MDMQNKFLIRPINGNDKNIIVSIIVILGWLILIGGLIGGLLIANTEITYAGYTFQDFSWTTAIIYWAAAIISSIILFGFSEIIRLLQLKQSQQYEIITYEKLDKKSDAEIKQEKQANDGLIVQPIEVLEETDTTPKTAIFEHRPEKTLTCPVCWERQQPTRNKCWGCGTLFIFKDEQK